MFKIILAQDQIREIVAQNRYQVEPEKKFLSRCIDDRYQEDQDLHPLSLPGGDAGELALLSATANTYGFTVDLKKAFNCLVDLVGGEKNFSFHTDKKHIRFPVAGCGYFKQMEANPDVYGLNKEQLSLIKTILKSVLAETGEEEVLSGEHLAGALIIIKGSDNIYPCYTMETEEGRQRIEFFVYHQSLVDERHRVLASTLLRQKAVKLFGGCDENYLYQVISETAENHLMETSRRLAKGLPIYQVKFDNEGGFEIEEMGKV